MSGKFIPVLLIYYTVGFLPNLLAQGYQKCDVTLISIWNGL
ncbi:hypothetical protein CSC35_0014 [Enterobacter hormaechei]|nr:hypothetical protein CSC35_0014 [Enterobacter hormaechei]